MQGEGARLSMCDSCAVGERRLRVWEKGTGGLGFRVQGSGFMVQGSEFRV